ncbi:unnamed protein product, partial [Polarella glacialis]
VRDTGSARRPEGLAPGAARSERPTERSRALQRPTCSKPVQPKPPEVLSAVNSWATLEPGSSHNPSSHNQEVASAPEPRASCDQLFNTLRSSALGIVEVTEDQGLDVESDEEDDEEKEQSEDDELEESESPDFFGFALRVAARHDAQKCRGADEDATSTASADSLAHLEASLLDELFHQPLTAR